MSGKHYSFSITDVSNVVLHFFVFLRPIKNDYMFKKDLRFWLFIFLFTAALAGESQELPDNFCLTNDEMQLFDKINQLRQSYGKTDLQLSASLSFVAKTHVKDLLDQHPDTSVCNLSSWSNKGNWTACCYNSYVPKPDCMWDKPKELTPYPYRGYEFVSYFDDQFSVDSVINLFSDTKEVLDMILTQQTYDTKKWICCGVGMNDHYVSIWFGQRKDALSVPKSCEGISTTAVLAPSNSIATSSYYIIFGSYVNMQIAKEELKKIKKDDFSDAGILNKNGQIRIYLEKYATLKEAMYAKQQLSAKYLDAWILKE
jgi:hypothetical protein